MIWRIKKQKKQQKLVHQPPLSKIRYIKYLSRSYHDDNTVLTILLRCELRTWWFILISYELIHVFILTFYSYQTIRPITNSGDNFKQHFHFTSTVILFHILQLTAYHSLLYFFQYPLHYCLIYFLLLCFSLHYISTYCLSQFITVLYKIN